MSEPSSSPSPTPALRTAGSLRGTDLIAFNHHLAALATAGLPLEQGLRLAAADARTSRVRKAISSLADDLDRGIALPAAFDRHRAAFPPIYGQILQGAVETNNLPALLLSLGKHQETVACLRSLIARALAYPMTVVFGLLIVTALISIYVLPQMEQMNTAMINHARVTTPWYSRYRGQPSPPPNLPVSTQIVMLAGPYLPFIALGLAALIAAIPLLLTVLRSLRLDARFADALLLRLPLIGPALTHSAIARFLDVLAVSIQAGLDLPRAITLAGNTVGYPRLIADAGNLSSTLASGQKASAVPRLQILPRTLPDSLDAASRNSSLGETVESLALLHRQQAELRVQRVPLVLIPLSILLVGGAIALLLAAILAPLHTALRSIL